MSTFEIKGFGWIPKLIPTAQTILCCGISIGIITLGALIIWHTFLKPQMTHLQYNDAYNLNDNISILTYLVEKEKENSTLEENNISHLQRALRKDVKHLNAYNLILDDLKKIKEDKD